VNYDAAGDIHGYLFTSPSVSVAASRYTWDFHWYSDDAKYGKVDISDHAMLIAELK